MNGKGRGKGSHLPVFACVLEGEHDQKLNWLLVASQLSLFHSETQGFWSILKVIPSSLTVKTVSLTQNVEPNHPN